MFNARHIFLAQWLTKLVYQQKYNKLYESSVAIAVRCNPKSKKKIKIQD